METVGALRIFERSYISRGLQYKDMLGDGDSATYNKIVQRKPYGDECIPKKLECIGHVQKRVGSRLRKLKSANKGLKLADGKGQMAKSIKASLYHVASTDLNPQHHLCPNGEDSWCGYKRDEESYKHKNGIPECIVKKIKPIFDELSQPQLLQKCTHGMTQNVNECLNGLIWDRCPKTTYVEHETVALSTYLAVVKFNDGDISFLKIFEDLDIKPGSFTVDGGMATTTTVKRMEGSIWHTYGCCDDCKKWEKIDKFEYRKWRESKDYEVWKESHESGKAKCARVSKLDCVGHVQKRMGTHLLELRKKEPKLKDGKNISERQQTPTHGQNPR
ncbi:Hypothetical predicted protein [Paramuricea clavata]|uniref:Mutator-like transposase domain-containing protein n=1 Tax=Paramuricea clavata TaxID=317549 RepID=A0A6S7HXP2_PARCT|nr:Hypothetical predicted protein [Paramuricea clavata]